MHLYIHSTVIYNSQDLETAQVSINRWVDKKDVVRLHDEYYMVVKRKELLPFVTAWMDLDGECYSKGNKPVRERQIPYDLTHLWNLMNKKTEEQNKTRGMAT